MKLQLSLLLALLPLLLPAQNSYEYRYWTDGDTRNMHTGTASTTELHIEADVSSLKDFGLHTLTMQIALAPDSLTPPVMRYFVKVPTSSGQGPCFLSYRINDEAWRENMLVTADGIQHIDAAMEQMAEGLHTVTCRLSDAEGRVSSVWLSLMMHLPASDYGISGYDWWVNDDTSQPHHTDLPSPVLNLTLSGGLQMPAFPFSTARYGVYEDEEGLPWACNADTLHLRFYGQNGTTTETKAVYLDLRTAHLLMDESATEPPMKEQTADVLLLRSLRADAWNTLCLPFAMTHEEVEAQWGEGTQVARFTGIREKGTDEMVLVFMPTDKGVEANVPCIVMPTANPATLCIDTRQLSWQQQPEEQQGAFSFLGNYASGVTVPAGDYYVSGNLFYLSQGLSTMDGYRGWFRDNAPAAAPRRLTMTLRHDDGTTTPIVVPAAGSEPTHRSGSAHDLHGLRRKATGKGIILYDGKKFISRP